MRYCEETIAKALAYGMLESYWVHVCLVLTHLGVTEKMM